LQIESPRQTDSSGRKDTAPTSRRLPQWDTEELETP
jgi:hypothetical protein